MKNCKVNDMEIALARASDIDRWMALVDQVKDASGLTVGMLDIFSEGEMVATRVLYDGIHSGTCMGIPASGKRIQFEALENFRVASGKIVESWGYWPDREIEEKLR